MLKRVVYFQLHYGLTCSYYKVYGYRGISACFFNLKTCKPIHAFLNLIQRHPHTGEKLAQCLTDCLSYWNINPDHVVLVVFDNVKNVVKDLKIVQEKYLDDLEDGEETGDESNSEEEDNDEYGSKIQDTDEMEIWEQVGQFVPYRHMSCLIHTLQLVIKQVHSSKQNKKL